MNIAAIDDDKETAKQIKIILNKFALEHHITINTKIFYCGENFLDIYKPNDFDIIFIDIYMEKISGVETAKIIRESDNNCLIIFLTTSLEHMQEAFSCHAFEYIIKPIDKDRIFAVMKDALEIIPQLSKYIEVTSKRKKIIILLSELVSVISNGHYLHIKDIKDNEYTVRMTLTELKKLLQNDARFLTVNKGILVNMDFIETIKDNHCLLSDNQRLPIKIRESAQIQQNWQDYNFDKIRSAQKNTR